MLTTPRNDLTQQRLAAQLQALPLTMISGNGAQIWLDDDGQLHAKTIWGDECVQSPLQLQDPASIQHFATAVIVLTEMPMVPSTLSGAFWHLRAFMEHYREEYDLPARWPQAVA